MRSCWRRSVMTASASRWAARPEIGPCRGEGPEVGARHPRVEDVAEDDDLAAVQVGARQALAQRVQVEQGLGGMGVPAIAGVDDVSAEDGCGEVRGTAAGMAYDEHVRAEGLDGAHRVHQRLAL